jgi:hypothetical protein
MSGVLEVGWPGAIPRATRPELKHDKGQPRAINMWQWTRSVCRQPPRGPYPGKLPAGGNRTGWPARRRARASLDRHATYIVTAYLAGAAR